MNKYPISFNDNGWEYVSEWVNSNVTLYDIDGNKTTYDNATHYSIADGVTIIAEGAFDSCESLVSITIPNEITTIAGTAFATCPSLTNIIIPEGVTTIGAYAFYYCQVLSTIAFPSTVTTIGGDALSGCSALTEVTLPVIDYPSQIFSDNTSLTLIYANPIEEGDALKTKLEVANKEYVSLVLLQANIVELKDKNNRIIYPITPSEAVYTSNNNTLAVELENKLDKTKDIFIGTQEEYNILTTEEKESYSISMIEGGSNKIIWNIVHVGNTTYTTNIDYIENPLFNVYKVDNNSLIAIVPNNFSLSYDGNTSYIVTIDLTGFDVGDYRVVLV